MSSLDACTCIILDGLVCSITKYFFVFLFFMFCSVLFCLFFVVVVVLHFDEPGGASQNTNNESILSDPTQQNVQ